jgi:adhesin transport system outer membrane protein
MVRGVPATTEEAMNAAIRQSAAVTASIEALRAARSAAQLRQAAYQPRVEARLRTGGGNNYDGVRDQKRDSAAEVVLNWNLYNGGADQARVRQQTNLLNQAADLRDKACRDTRQNAAIAYNDVVKLEDQLRVLDRNVLAIEKTRDAYRQQFNIGQRSLLDLLNSENELYTARRSYTTADYDRLLAQARLLAAMQQLTQRLGLRAPISAADAGSDGSWNAGDDTPQRCPVMVANIVTTPLSELDQRAQRLHESVPRPAR